LVDDWDVAAILPDDGHHVADPGGAGVLVHVPGQIPAGGGGVPAEAVVLQGAMQRGGGPTDTDDHGRLGGVVDHRGRFLAWLLVRRSGVAVAAPARVLVQDELGGGAGVNLDRGAGRPVAPVEQFEFGSASDDDPITLHELVGGVLGGPAEQGDVEELGVGRGPFAVALDTFVAGDPQVRPAGARVADSVLGIGDQVAVDGDSCGHADSPNCGGIRTRRTGSRRPFGTGFAGVDDATHQCRRHR